MPLKYNQINIKKDYNIIIKLKKYNKYKKSKKNNKKNNKDNQLKNLHLNRLDKIKVDLHQN